jgi:DNA-binding transcriptional ArsR family regulator
VELIAAQQSLQYEFRQSLLHDMLTTLVLVHHADDYEGLSTALTSISTRVRQAKPVDFHPTVTALILMMGLQGWLVERASADDPAHVTFDALHSFIENLPLNALAEAMRQALLDRAALLDISVTSRMTTYTLLQAIQVEREKQPLPAINLDLKQFTSWLGDPARFQFGLLQGLDALWNSGYGEQYAESQEYWQNALRYHLQQNYNADFETTVRSVTGRHLHQRIAKAAEQARYVEWFPSCYVGPYVVYNLHRDTLRISFNANLAPRVSGTVPDLSTMFPVFRALADETRLQILTLLLDQREYTVGDLAEKLNLSHSHVSRQLALLAQTELVIPRPQATMRYYRINPTEIQKLAHHLITLTQLENL